MERIISADNPKVQQWARLKQKKYRKEQGAFLLESARGIQEALDQGVRPQAILFRKGTAVPEGYQQHLPGIAAYILTEKAFQKLTATENSMGILGVFISKKNSLRELLTEERILFLDGIQDPGNLGTILRTATAFRIYGIILGNGTVDLYNEKVLRSTLGGLFPLKIMEGTCKELRLLQKHGYRIAGGDLTGIPFQEWQPTGKWVLGIGGENKGLSEDFREIMDQGVTIPMPGPMESLNAGVAAGILMSKFTGE